MKKLLSLSMALILAAGLISGCGCAKQDKTETAAPGNQTEQTETAQPAEGGEAPAVNGEEAPAETPSVELPAVSENKEVVTKDAAPKVVMIKNAENNVDSLTYHLEGCKTLEGKEAQEVSWEMVQMVGFWQCPECNPPRYEDYKNAE